MVGLSFHGIFWKLLVIGENNLKKIDTTFSPLIHLPCYRQVAENGTFISDFSGYHQNAFPYTKRKTFL